MFSALPLAVGFIFGTLTGIALMALFAAGELRTRTAKAEVPARHR